MINNLIPALLSLDQATVKCLDLAEAKPEVRARLLSWSDAAGKHRHPMSRPRHKQLEQPNSLRETLFSQSGRGDQNFKQDTSWVQHPSVSHTGGKIMKVKNKRVYVMQNNLKSEIRKLCKRNRIIKVTAQNLQRTINYWWEIIWVNMNIRIEMNPTREAYKPRK